MLSYEGLLELLPDLKASTEAVSQRPRLDQPRKELSMSEKTVVLTDNAPAPAHVFSQGIKKGGFFQVSGQGPMDPATNQYIGEGDVRVQTRRTLENVKAILEAGGSSVEDVLMFRVYLTTRDDFAAMNEVYGEFIKRKRPQRRSCPAAPRCSLTSRTR